VVDVVAVFGQRFFGSAEHPIWLASTIEHHAQPGGALDKSCIRRGRPPRGERLSKVAGPERVVVQRRPVEIAPEVEVAS
jgi:hypothetical protein